MEEQISLHPNELALIKRLREDFGNSEVTIVTKDGIPQRIKLIVARYPLKHGLDRNDLWEYIQQKAPFGEVTIRSHRGQPTHIERIINYMELSTGL
jgi:hypothetical protein